MLWLAMSLALAEDLVLTDLRVDATDGVTLDYALSSGSWAICESSLRTAGVAPALVVTVASGGMTRTQHVELHAPTGAAIRIAPGSWPPGLTATVSLRDETAGFSALRGPSSAGRALKVPVSGGVSGADPLGVSPPSTVPRPAPAAARPEPWAAPPAPAPTPDPAQVLAAAAQAAQQAEQAERTRQHRAELDRQRAEYVAAVAAERARVDAIGQDPSHPLSAACLANFPGEAYWTCVYGGVYRTDGAREVEACGRMARPGLRLECLESMPARNYLAGDIAHACVDVFGPEVPSMRCLNAVLESPHDPAGDVRACGAGFSAVEDQMACIKRFHLLPWDPTPLIQACVQTFEEVPIECLHAGARADGTAEAVARACGAALPDLEALPCLQALRGVRDGNPTGVVPACVDLFPHDAKSRQKCFELARRDASPDRILACAAEIKPGRRFACIEG